MASRMNGPRSCRKQTIQRVVAIAALALVSVGGGCSWLGRWPPGPPPPPEPCVLSENASKDEIVAHINQRAMKLAAWQCSDATISTNQMLGSFDALIAVQRAKNFRLVVSTTMTGNEVDIGSNSERIWFWVARDKSKKIFTVRHDRLDRIEGRLPIPFRPDWLMEALGVIPLNAENVRMLPRRPGDKMARLIVREYTPAGRIVQRIIEVDCCRGNVVSQSLRDENGRVLMLARFDGFRTERYSGLKMPYRIDLKWPQADMAMTLQLNTIKVNPKEFAPRTWTLPAYDGCQALDLARGLAASPRANGIRHAERQQRNPGRTRIQPLRHERPNFEEDKGTVQPIPSFRQQQGDVRPIGRRTSTRREPGPFARPFPETRSADVPHFTED